jgi:hypothetical protein
MRNQQLQRANHSDVPLSHSDISRLHRCHFWHCAGGRFYYRHGNFSQSAFSVFGRHGRDGHHDLGIGSSSTCYVSVSVIYGGHHRGVARQHHHHSGHTAYGQCLASGRSHFLHWLQRVNIFKRCVVYSAGGCIQPSYHNFYYVAYTCAFNQFSKSFHIAFNQFSST